MANKQTAIEWFAIEALKLHINAATKTLPIAVFEVAYSQIIEQAKEMEKEQIIEAVEWNYKSNMGLVYYKATYESGH
jgi:hypothetical protein